MNEIIWFVIGILALSVIAGLLQPSKKKKGRRSGTRKKQVPKKAVNSGFNRASPTCRADEVILTLPLDKMTGAEFERLLTLYFRDNGYTVKEVGVGGRDGGVDLVITDKRGEKTAVQAKCYADHNKVQVMTVRELVGAKRNHDCILSLLITTSDLTGPARKEADQFKVDYWHGGLVDSKLRSWGKWNPSNKKAKAVSVRKEQPSSKTVSSIQCSCGAPMIKRKNKAGAAFWGCSNFPNCRKTKAI
ncbi:MULTISPECIES: restriction endonuclease [unclassified Paenibacillus]|uniref:restriction endonuclease n=1 Tax=unclassified Paenibacillus TaxID=185978 RepID=UPI000FE23AA1|nr:MULTISPECIES: restriction endonuclease [unclassified Paenibacillus]MCM3174225.1 restriction endonuclease [Paenibacillus sp. MER 99-2]